MVKILSVNSSPGINWSITRQLMGAFTEANRAAAPGAEIVERDIGKTPPPHITEATIGAYFTPPDNLTPQQQTAISLSNELVEEFLASDIVVIGAPMHNFGIPSGLKAYIDHIIRVGRTFTYSETGPVGMVKGKRIFVLTSRGSDYSEGGPMFALDHQENYLRTIFGFIGVSDMTFIHCQGTAISEDFRNSAIANVKSQIQSQVGSIAADQPAAVAAA